MRIQVNQQTVFVGTGSGQHTSQKRTVVFLHGAGMDHSVWLMPARYFARQGFNVVAPDFPAHGGSDGQALTSVDAMADWLTAVLDTLGLGEVDLVGHSMGSLVALDWASRHADRLHRLVLLGTSAPMPVSDALLDAAETRDRDAMQMANQWSHSSTAVRCDCFIGPLPAFTTGISQPVTTTCRVKRRLPRSVHPPWS